MTQPEPESRLRLYRAARRTAAVSGSFSVVVCVMLIVNFAGTLGAGPIDSPEMANLREKLVRNPSDKDLKQRIQDLDLELRQRQARSTLIASQGGWLLLGGLAATVLCLRYAAALRRKLPMPGPAGGTAGDSRARARLAVAAVAAGVAAGALALVISGLNLPGRHAVPAAAPPGKAQPAPKPAAAVDTKSQQEAQPREAAVDPKMTWPRFRGPGGLGVAASGDFPLTWNGASGEGIAWKTEVPLPGLNSPVVWGNRVFLTGANKEKREVYCFDADSGKLLWSRPVENVPGSPAEPPQIMEGIGAGYAAPTGATDGKHFCAIFANGDLVCFDFDGKLLWSIGLGAPENSYGHASSLVIHKDLLLVQFDQGHSPEEGKSRLSAMDLQTGRTAWEAKRPVMASWATPIVIETPKGAQVITASMPLAIACDPAYGTELWRANVLSGEIAVSPIFSGGMVFICNDGSPLTAIRPDGSGDVTQTHVAWQTTEGMPDIVSPLTDGKLLFLMRYGTLACYDAQRGQAVWTQDLGGEFNASPVLAGTRVYLLSKPGVMTVFEAANAYRELGRAELGEECSATPAFVDGRIYIRGAKHLYCIGKRNGGK